MANYLTRVLQLKKFVKNISESFYFYILLLILVSISISFLIFHMYFLTLTFLVLSLILIHSHFGIVAILNDYCYNLILKNLFLLINFLISLKLFIIFIGL